MLHSFTNPLSLAKPLSERVNINSVNMKRKKKYGRPSVFNKNILQKLQWAFAIGATDKEVCVFADISVSTLYNYQFKNPDFLEWKEEIKESVTLKARMTIVEAIRRGDAKIAMWYLERKRSEEFSSKPRCAGIGEPPELSEEEEQQIQEILDELEI